jgi:hypothetical protein
MQSTAAFHSIVSFSTPFRKTTETSITMLRHWYKKRHNKNGNTIGAKCKAAPYTTSIILYYCLCELPLGFWASPHSLQAFRS